MSYYRLLSAVVVLLLATFTSSCKKEENQVGFRWLKAGQKMHYDYYGPTDTIQDITYLQFGGGRLVEFPRNSTSSNMFYLWGTGLQVKDDGLYALECSSCGWGILSCSTRFAFMYAPNTPKQGQQLPVYSCGESVSGYSKILNADTTVTVPMGTYRAYVMLDEHGARLYWSPEHGLLMYQYYQNRNRLPAGTLKLNRMSF